MNKKNKLSIFSGLLVIETIALVYFSITPGEIPVVGEYRFSFIDLILHFVGYFVYGILGERTINLGGRRRSLLIATIMGSLLGILTETLQSFVPYRSPSMLDLTADIAGSVFGGYLSFRFKK